MTDNTQTEALLPSRETLMAQAQVFASAWAIAGSSFDSGDGMEVAEQEKAILADMTRRLHARIAELEAQLESIRAGGVNSPLMGQPQAMPDLTALTERGAKAWTGVDAQALREGRWYMVTHDGVATLCEDRRDAEKEAKDADMAWPHSGPHRAVQLVEASTAGFTAADMATASAQGFRDGVASVSTGSASMASYAARLLVAAALVTQAKSDEVLRFAAEIPATPGPAAQAEGWINVKDRLPEKNTEVLIFFAELSIPSTGRYTASALDHEGWCYPQENHLWPGERPDFEDGGSPTVTHWMKLPEAPALLMERAMSDTTTPKGQALTPAIGGLYNWKGQPERLVYMGARRYPGDPRPWHQFAKVETPEDCWSEVLTADLASFEETDAKS